MGRTRKPPCPFCGRRAVGLECQDPACRARVAKQRAEPDEEDGNDGQLFRALTARPQTGGGVRVIRDARGLA